MKTSMMACGFTWIRTQDRFQLRNRGFDVACPGSAAGRARPDRTDQDDLPGPESPARGTIVLMTLAGTPLVTAITVGPLAWRAANARPGQARPVAAGPCARTVLDLAPMFLIASGIRALLGTGLALHGSFAGQLADGAVLSPAVSNLPAAAAIIPAGAPGLWAAILATTVGPNLLITSSVATLITRRIARDAGARLATWQFSAIGLAPVLPGRDGAVGPLPG
jgi:hypothetical protein